MKKQVIVIEGLVHAGKTTLAKKLAKSCKGVQYVGEYVDFTTGKFPDYPCNLEDARNARKFFLDLERKRIACIDDINQTLILDRSFLSILAYHFAVESMTERAIPCFSESIRIISEESWILPDSCIYLDVSDLEILRRHQSESGHYSSILLSPDFNALLRRFYEKTLPMVFPSLKLIRIDADKSLMEVSNEAETLLGK